MFICIIIIDDVNFNHGKISIAVTFLCGLAIAIDCTVIDVSHLCAADAFRRKRRFGLSGRHLGRSMTGGSSKPGRPSRLTQSASSASLNHALRRQNSRADFDINSVVIPYSATAAPSVIDRQEYKEIITPK